MFCLSTEYGNRLDLADSVLNSLEINVPFISCINKELKYYVSYYFDNKAIVMTYAGEDSTLDKLLQIFWEGANGAEQQIAEALAYQEPVIEFENMPQEYFEKAAEAILAAMDGFSRAVEGPAF